MHGNFVVNPIDSSVTSNSNVPTRAISPSNVYANSRAASSSYPFRLWKNGRQPALQKICLHAGNSGRAFSSSYEAGSCLFSMVMELTEREFLRGDMFRASFNSSKVK